VLEQIEQVPGVAPIGLCLAYHHRPDLPRLPHQHGVAQAVHQSVKPLAIAGGLNPDGHRRSQRAIEPLHRVAVMSEFLLEDLSGRRVEHSHLLFAGMQITSDKCHERDLLSGNSVTVSQPERTRCGGPFS